MWQITLRQPWLVVEFPRPMISWGWTPQGGGQQETQSLLWREVRNADLSEDFDVLTWLAGETRSLGHADAPCFLTSAQIAAYQTAEAEVEGRVAKVLVTAGLGNGERIGQRRWPAKRIGTINALLVVNCGLSPAAALEALSLMAEARTTAMLDDAAPMEGISMTGTGTDCLALCFEKGANLESYAGKHTALGEAIGCASLSAFSKAIRAWVAPA